MFPAAHRCCPKELQICQSSLWDPNPACCKTACITQPGTNTTICCPEEHSCPDPSDPTGVRRICCPKPCATLTASGPPVCCDSGIICQDMDNPETKRSCCDISCLPYGTSNLMVCCPKEQRVVDSSTGAIVSCCPKEDQVKKSLGAVVGCCAKDRVYGDPADPKCCPEGATVCTPSDGSGKVCCWGRCDEGTGACCPSNTTPCDMPWLGGAVTTSCCSERTKCVNGQ
jgi:hypothetical protein